uniref:Uncharacterized protein n=1 Tax=Arundo donax TaxID=35708 RepID=A0A0A9HJZ1_ARUDO
MLITWKRMDRYSPHTFTSELIFLRTFNSIPGVRDAIFFTPACFFYLSVREEDVESPSGGWSLCNCKA